MKLLNAGSRFAPIAEELIENQYARERLQDGANKLHDAYSRAQKRRVKPTRDRKLRAQFEAAISALDEGSAALFSGRRKPKRSGRKLLLGAVGLGAAGLVAAVAVNDELRESLLGSAKALGDEISDPSDD